MASDEAASGDFAVVGPDAAGTVSSGAGARWRRWLVAGFVLGMAVVVAGLGSVLTTGEPASAQGVPATYLAAGHSGLCLTVANGATAAVTTVVQEACTGVASQAWTAVDAGGGYVQLKVGHTGMCLNVEGASTADLARLIQYPCAGAANEQFRFDPPTGDLRRIVARQSGKCLDIEGASQAGGAQLIQYTCSPSTAANQQFGPAGAIGRWSDVIDLPLVPVAAANLPNGKVLMWSAYSKTDFGGDNGYTQTLVFDPAAVTFTERQVANTGHDMFCPGVANLPDGRILVNGGSSSARTSIYDPATDSWTAGSDMNIPRGYEGTTLLGDGSVLTLGGSWSGALGNKNAEIWTAAGGWRLLPGVTAAPFTGPDPAGVFRGDNHLWLFGWTGGRVFHAGPTREMHWIDTAGNGSVTSAGNRGNDAYAINGNAVMYAPGRILTMGGAPAYDNGTATSRGTVIDINGPAVSSRTVGSMAYTRGFHNSVVLPDGQVVVVGGQNLTVPFSDAGAVLPAEIWNPQTEQFRTVAAMQVPRVYHSFALLQPDGRVLVGGGGLCGTCNTNHPNVQVFTPPYLLRADGTPATQPRIISAPTSVDLDQVFTVTTNTPASEMVLVRMASATHSVNNDQRRIPLQFSAGSANLTYEVTAPSDPGVATPGSYMLFVLDADGVPSVSKVVTVTNNRAVASPTVVKGRVVDTAGVGVAGVAIGHFTQDGNGLRAQWLGDVITDSAGNYQFTVAGPGCYTTVATAPSGRSFIGGGQYAERSLCVTAGQAGVVADATLLAASGGSTALGGRVTAGSGVSGVQADLFLADGNGLRAGYLGSTGTDATGTYRFDVTPGCYVVVLVAPSGRTFTNGSVYREQARCLSGGQVDTTVGGVLAGGPGAATIGDQVTRATTGAGVGGVQVDLFVAGADGTRNGYVGTTYTDGAGRYGFSQPPGCYVVVFVAPTGEGFVGTGQYREVAFCVAADQIEESIDAVVA